MEKKERIPSHPRPPSTPLPPATATVPASQDGSGPCSSLDSSLDPVLSLICGMLLVFGLVYTVFGYRCFKAVMFLTGFIFGSIVVYLICLEENLLSHVGNVAASVGAGVLFGLITMLVQYVGLFMTGFHTGLLAGVVTLVAMDAHSPLTTVWSSVGVLIGSGLVFAVLTLRWQKGLTVMGTSIYGGAVIASSLDYFVERFVVVDWVWDRVKVAPPPPRPPCWLSWLVLAVWPVALVLGSATQFCITATGIYHQEFVPRKRIQQASVQRLRNQEVRVSQRQRRYRYLYQLRTAHGDVISQSYIRSLQGKASPTSGMFTTQSNCTQTTTLNASESTSHVP